MVIIPWILILLSIILKADREYMVGAGDGEGLSDNVTGENTQTFRQATCQQIGKHVHCEDVSTNEERETSDWPPGVYSIPKPITGCPETDNKGWTEGFISIKWLSPHTPYSVTYNSSELADNVSESKVINSEEWPKFYTYMFGPFKDYLFRLNFCTKQSRPDNIDIGKWPDGSYSIYGDSSGCPAGFTNKTMTISLGEIHYWTSGGYVPEFEMETIVDTVTLRLTLCSRDDVTMTSTNTSELVTMANNAFLLIKDADSSCPEFEEFTCIEESLYLDGTPENNNNYTLVQSHCFYQPNQWNTDHYKALLLEEFGSKGYLILNTHMIEGTKSIGQQSTKNAWSLLNIKESQVQVATYIPWKVIDMGRSFSVVAVWLKVINGAMYVPSIDTVPTCFISNEKWCFLHACALKCMFSTEYKTDRSTLQLLFVRPMKGRYIALATEDELHQILHSSTDIQVFTNKLKNNADSVCNIDLGMTDGGILDFQITASSFQSLFTPSQSRPFYSGWCSDSEDSSPFIQVDLLVATTVEGITIWNWQETVTTMNEVVWDTVIHFGVEILSVLYGKTKQDLIAYNQAFHFDLTRPLDEPQSFSFLKPITARYIQLQINKSITEGLNCLKFEIHGCRVSGIPSLDCSSDSEMFPLTKVPTISNYFKLHNVSTHEECTTLCMQTEICSSVSFFNTDCIMYSDSKEKKYQMYNTDNDLRTWSTKICYQDQFISGPRLHNIEQGDIASSNVYEINKEGIISSPRYPFSYPSGHDFKWIITIEQQTYVKLAFTNISLNKFEDSTTIDNRCEDSIQISNSIHDTSEAVRVLDYRFNGVLSVIETSESVLVVTLKSCLPRSKSSMIGRGFRAIVIKNYMPACFSLDSTLAWEKGRDEVCPQPSMSLTSMSLLGLPFSGTTERWQIISKGKRIIISFEEFHVVCKTEEDGSEFLIRDLEIEKSFCNLNRPPVKYYSASDTVMVSFYKGFDPPYITFKEGFRLTYITEKVSMEYLISYRAYRSNITNVALGKPAIMSSLYIYKSRDFLSATKGTDGTVHLDASYGACFHTKNELEPWWMVDLQGIYTIDRIVLYNKQENRAAILARNIEISVGTSIADMRVTSYLCLGMDFRKTFDQYNIRGRFVKLQIRHFKQKFHLCEVEVYGVLDTDIDTKYKRNIPFPDPVQGNWGHWGSWSNLCYCNGKQPRIRKCDEPKPSFGGSKCIGSDIGYRSCLPSTNCTLYNVAFEKPSSMSSQEHSWSGSNQATDGITLQTKLSCFQTKFEYQPWWMVDLQGIYELEKLIVFTQTDCCSYRRQNIGISVGVSCDMMKVVHFECGDSFGSQETLWMIGYTARFVKLQIIGRNEYLNLCEIEIYGQPALNEKVLNQQCHNVQDGVYGAWSQWSECSEKCGIGRMTRTRICDSPAPSNGGLDCHGDDTEIQNCVGRGNCPICSETFGKCYSLFPKLTNWKDAGFECWKRKMRLVSVRSREELSFINYLLRESRYADKQPLATFDSVFRNASYYAHLGLYRYPLGDGTKFDLWEDKTPVTFTAWKFGEPSYGNCVRMNYKSFDDRNTWESEDCERVLAEYFICEQKIINESTVLNEKEVSEVHGKDWHKVPEQITSSQYLGMVDTTKAGFKCITWEEQDKNPFRLWWNGYITYWQVPQSIKEARNYCRDPGSENFVWCPYRTSTNAVKRDGCSVEMPFVENTQQYEWRYMGKHNKTFSGKTCQFWNTLSPHSHHTTGYNVPGETINSVKNYCRDVWNSGYLWCYTTDQDTRWEMCIVEDNPDDRCSLTHTLYAGRQNTTYTGKMCLHWGGVDGHIGRGFKNHMFPERSITAAGNLCRDPFGDGYPWCYVTNHSWEPCIITESREQTTALSELETTNGFECSNGDLISRENVCDERFDCEDMSDETDCKHKDQRLITAPGSSINDIPIPETFVLSSYFQCYNDDWISVTARCDRVKDCLDASDEFNCTISESSISECTDDQFRCDDGDCIHISEVCNFIDDCIDGSDEYCDFDECEKTEFRCDNGQCVSFSERCNGSPRCLDGTDEKFCDSCIEQEAFHCDIVKCIPLRLVCDKYRDCQDGSDEISCTDPDLTSCEQWWEAGYRESRNYVIGGLTVFCDFDSVMTDKKMFTIIRNFDILWRDGDGVGYLYSRDTLREEDVRLDEIINRPNYRCVQKVTQSCIHSHKTVAEYDDPLYSDTFKHCQCVDQIIVVGFNSTIEHCNRSDSSLESKDELIYAYNISIPLYRKIVVDQNIDYVKQGYQLVPGAAFCEYDYIYEENVSTCDGDVNNIPASIYCVYDLDASGYKLGCRSGSHLQNCENHECQEGTVKCPGSYCIPLRFVCDGEPQCPQGEDEEACGCGESDNEILILYDSERTTSKALNVYKFAKQFSTERNTVRLLSYVMTQPLIEFSLGDSVLQITDTLVHAKSTLNRVKQCRYNMMTKDAVDTIHLSAQKSSGIIYIQDDSAFSIDLFDTMFTTIDWIGKNISIYRVRENQMNDTGMEPTANVIEIGVRRWKLLNNIGAEYLPMFCKAKTKVKCPNKYRCKWSKMCIPLNQVCDGQTHCPHDDDEMLCNFKCPQNCFCVGYKVNCSNNNFTLNNLNTVPETTRQLDLSFNTNLQNIFKGSYFNSMVLVKLNLSSCDIIKVTKYSFRKIKNLVSLDLSFNSIKVIKKQTFSYLKHLRILRLTGNFGLNKIESGAFDALSNIYDLDLAGALLTKIKSDTFSGLILQSIDLSNNSIEEIENFAFRNLAVKSINFENNKIAVFRKEIFTGVDELETLRTPAFKFCCIRPNYLSEEGCYPPKDEFSSCEDLMRLSALQTMLWLIGISALVGNALTIMYRLIYDRSRLRLGFGIFVTNLALADFIMGVYLLIIAVADAIFRKRYIFMDEYWRNSAWCNLAGVLSTISSEASVFFLCLITLDRLFVIKFPFGQVRFDKRKSLICSGAVWFVCIFLAVFPIMYESYFQNKFYTKSGVCIALPLTRDRPPGWVYSVVIFVGLNFATFVLVAFGQWSIFMEIRSVSGGMEKTSSGRNNDLKVARNLLLVVLTDFLCWFPIGVMGMMALYGHVISGDVYAWSAVFILPINSALNPILYTISSIIGRKTFNPSADEQSRAEMSKEFGSHILKFQRVSRHFSVIKRRKIPYKSISSLLQNDDRLKPIIAAKAVYQLAKCLDVLHGSSLVIGELNASIVCVGVVKGKITGEVQIQKEPRIADSNDDSKEDMFNVGKIVRSMLSKCKQSLN